MAHSSERVQSLPLSGADGFGLEPNRAWPHRQAMQLRAAVAMADVAVLLLRAAAILLLLSPLGLLALLALA